MKWDGGKAWPVGHTAQFDPASSPAAAQWTAGLSPAPTGQPPTVLERLLLEHTTSVDRVVELLYDEGSGCPALRRVDHMGEVTCYTRVPQRISTVSPLAEVTLGGNTVWIRTADGRLWLARNCLGTACRGDTAEAVPTPWRLCSTGSSTTSPAHRSQGTRPHPTASSHSSKPLLRTRRPPTSAPS